MKTLSAALFALLVTASAFAQNSGTITGIVVDQSGGAVSGATVTLQDEKVPKKFSATTDQRGEFTLSGVSAGRHVLRVEKSQFAPARIETQVDPTATAAAPLRIALTVAGVRESVDVAAPTAPYAVPTATTATTAISHQSLILGTFQAAIRGPPGFAGVLPRLDLSTRS